MTGKYLGALGLAAAVLAGACTGGGGIGVRVYDRPYHDYHQWDAREETVFQGYWSEHHRDDHRAYKQLKAHEQAEYWNWRHSHPN